MIMKNFKIGTVSLAVFFSGYVSRFELDSSFLYFEAAIVHIDESLFRIRIVLWSINNP